jgi:hypothetical protein
MSKRKWQFGIRALLVLGGAAALLLWVGGSMGGPVVASAQDPISEEAGEPVGEEATEASADQIESGYDSWVTPDSGRTKMDVPFPAGFFCNGLSSAVTKTIKFKGVPFQTDPAGEVGEADTLIERLDTATFVNGVATTRIRIVGLSLASSAPITIACPNGTTESWSAKLTLDPNVPAPLGSMTIRQNALNSGGTFDSDFDVPARITFSGPGGATAGPISHSAHMSGRNAPWSRIVATKVWRCRVGYWIDLDGDGIWDLYIEFWRCPGRGGFHPGWAPHPTNPNLPGTPIPWDHSAPHPEIWPVCWPTCRPPIIIGGGTGSGTGTGTSATSVNTAATGVVGN